MISLWPKLPRQGAFAKLCRLAAAVPQAGRLRPTQGAINTCVAKLESSPSPLTTRRIARVTAPIGTKFFQGRGMTRRNLHHTCHIGIPIRGGESAHSLPIRVREMSRPAVAGQVTKLNRQIACGIFRWDRPCRFCESSRMASWANQREGHVRESEIPKSKPSDSDAISHRRKG